ncbi:MAG TPA: mannonate dehydratase [Chloroflexota bacterium]|jgi:mannonate dehydratase|nr:mannonate dehydratase [Chloroflexota bacterium]
MYVGHQMRDISDLKLQWVAQLGVEHIACENREGVENEDGTWNVQGIKDIQARLRQWGITMDVLALNLPSQYMTRQRFPGIMRGLPSRDAEIEVIKQNVRAAAEAGVPCLKYNLNLLGVPRTGRTPGRGGARYSHFDIDEWTDHSLTEAGPMPAEKVWENITYFLERVVPVAEECRVRLACHPHDPAVPHDTGLRGVHCVLGSVEGLKRFVAICESPYHGLNFCQGTVAEMCVNPATEVIDAIRYFGERQKIFMVHFRNIKGGFLHFDEVYPDNGDVDMFQALKTYREAGVNVMLCPDHVPQSDADPGGERQFSFCLGYTKALLQAANA